MSAAPVTAQHGGGGHGGGGHSGGGHSGGGRATAGVTHGTAHPGAIGRATPAPGGHGFAVPRAAPHVERGHVDRRATLVVPSYRTRLGVGALGLGIGASAYASPFWYAPYPYRYSPYAYRNPSYYGYPSGYYGGLAGSGHPRLRILDAPRDAQVYVDGYYAGVVNDFDGVFQHLELAPGLHRIEIRAPGFAPIVFDVRAEAGRTITYRAQMVPYAP